MGDQAWVDEKVFEVVSGFQLLMLAAVGVFLIYLLIRKISSEKNEKFERREN